MVDSCSTKGERVVTASAPPSRCMGTPPSRAAAAAVDLHRPSATARSSGPSAELTASGLAQRTYQEALERPPASIDLPDLLAIQIDLTNGHTRGNG